MILNTEIFNNKKIIYLSPHFDDMVLSNGGLARKIYEGFKQFTLVNVFTNSLWAPNCPDTLDMKEITEIRHREDASYCSRLGLQYINLDFDDSSVRGYDAQIELSASVNEDKAYAPVKRRIAELLSDMDFDFVFCPLAVGNHIDHRIIFETVKEARPRNVLYYEDLPYALGFTEESIKSIAGTALKNPTAYYVEIHTVMDEKLNDIVIYDSQLEAEPSGNVNAYLHKLFQRDGFERIWADI
ncbi:LmbE family N-acetylglucosaminyl deacetylase [Anaerobacterium chartisolvens]|uniref:LmbE family N-acetylglucosaminyl deacetylase n=1 Tax=Anaerobacterium chartisolvens TaxID=1297424 RepID=A0A369AS85_9FIRM|nr:PIG-L family deacetylase [Anaerobacterium chartisolvens]RCX11126.1 LmbE family N-acetylglucosaminyl deacetylase [Anaerobacterium chartisolvens]